MKFIANRASLVEALKVVGAAVASRTPKPVLGCIKLTAESDRLTLAATDLEVAIRYVTTQVQIEAPGEILVPADKFRDIVTNSADDTLAVELVAETAVIRGADSVFKVYTQPVKDFPPIPTFEGDPDFELNGGTLKRLITQTVFAVAKESTRYAFNGVLVTRKGKQVQFVATDGRRLAKAATLVTRSWKDSANAIVPLKGIQMLAKLIEDPEAAVGFQVRENSITFKTDNATLTSNLVEGAFPPYEDVIPKDTDKKVTAGTEDLAGALRRASLLTSEESKGVRMKCSKKGVKLSSRTPEAGEAEVNFACKYEGADVEIGFNPRFLADGLRAAETDEVSLELTAPNRPGLLRAGADFAYVVMPVNLQ